MCCDVVMVTLDMAPAALEAAADAALLAAVAVLRAAERGSS